MFLFGTSFFVLEIFPFLYNANEGSGDVISRSTKTVQHSQKLFFVRSRPAAYCRECTQTASAG